MNFTDPFIISDTHLGHANVIRYCGRPFDSIEEHDRVLIDNWNSIVGEDDLIIHLGDFCFRSVKTGENAFDYYWNQLNGRMILIKGNHDKYQTCTEDVLVVKDKIQIGKYLLTHRPLIKNHIPGGMINVHGHIHQHESDHGINVSVERTGYNPVGLSTIELYGEMEKLTTHA